MYLKEKKSDQKDKKKITWCMEGKIYNSKPLI